MDTIELLSRKVSDIMSHNVTVVDENATMREVENLLKVNNIHHVPVIDKSGVLKGILSQQDVELVKNWATNLNAKSAEIQNDRLMTTQLAADRMSKTVVKVSPGDSLEYCAEIFRENLFHALPVVDNGKLVGIITTYDLLNAAYTKTHFLSNN